jgi:small nuclear ribonucleoprotein (snRNP)-like protein
MLCKKERGVNMYDQYHICHSCMNRRVSIQTTDGVYEGVIVNVDAQNVYLDTAISGAYVSSKKTNKKAKTSAFGFGFGGRQTILTLALFDLLAIALLV